MSTIHDALKKVQENFKERQNQIPPPHPTDGHLPVSLQAPDLAENQSEKTVTAPVSGIPPSSAFLPEAGSQIDGQPAHKENHETRPDAAALSSQQKPPRLSSVFLIPGIFLGILFTFSLIYFYLFSHPILRFPLKKISEKTVVPFAPAISPQANEGVSQTPRNPLLSKAPLTETSFPSESFTVQGVMLSSQGNSVLINNEIYEVGEKIGEMEILDITLEGVVVSENNRRKILRAKKGD